MASDNYGYADETSPATDESTHDESTPHEDKDEMEDKDEGETALIPKSLGAGKPFKAGDEIVLEIVHEYEAEYEVKYAKEKKAEDKPKRSQMDESNDALEKMGKPAEMGGY